MSKVYKKDTVPGSSDQKVSWRTVKHFDSYEDAWSRYQEEPQQLLTKIRRRKNGFDFQVGTPVKKKD